MPTPRDALRRRIHDVVHRHLIRPTGNFRAHELVDDLADELGPAGPAPSPDTATRLADMLVRAGVERGVLGRIDADNLARILLPVVDAIAEDRARPARTLAATTDAATSALTGHPTDCLCERCDHTRHGGLVTAIEELIAAADRRDLHGQP